MEECLGAVGLEQVNVLALEKHCCVQEYAGYQKYDTMGCKGSKCVMKLKLDVQPWSLLRRGISLMRNV